MKHFFRYWKFLFQMFNMILTCCKKPFKFELKWAKMTLRWIHFAVCGAEYRKFSWSQIFFSFEFILCFCLIIHFIWQGVVGPGKYYYEATVTDEGLCRLGFSTLQASLGVWLVQFQEDRRNSDKKPHAKVVIKVLTSNRLYERSECHCGPKKSRINVLSFTVLISFFSCGWMFISWTKYL